MFIQLVEDVKKETFGKQIPWLSSNADIEFNFRYPSKQKVKFFRIAVIDTCRDDPFTFK